MSEHSGEAQAEQDEQHDGGQPPAGGQAVGENGDSEEVEFAKLGILTYLVVGLGVFITFALKFLLADDDSMVYVTGLGFEDEELFAASVGAYDFILVFAPILAIVLAVYYYRADVTTEMTAKVAAIASAAGIAVTGIVLLLLVVVFEPSGVDVSIGDEIPGLLGVIIGTVIAGALAGYVLDEDPLEVL